MTLGIFYREWNPTTPNAWADWSTYLINSPALSKRIESDNEGEAGLIVFDDVELEMRLEKMNGTASPVAIALNEGTLNSKDRLMIQLRMYDSLSTYQTIFEGMIDLSSLNYPYNKDDSGDIIKTVSFTVVDKLSAMATLTPIGFGRECISLGKKISDTDGNMTTASVTGTASGSRGSNVVVLSDEVSKSLFPQGSQIVIKDIDDKGNDGTFIVRTNVGLTGGPNVILLGQNLPMGFSGKSIERKYWTISNEVHPFITAFNDETMLIKFYGTKTDSEYYGDVYDFSNVKNLTSNPIEVGDIIAYVYDGQDSRDWDMGYNEYYPDRNPLVFTDMDLFLVKEVSFSDINDQIVATCVRSTASVQTTEYDYPPPEGTADKKFQIFQKVYVFDKTYFGQTFLNTSGGVAQSYDALALLTTLIQSIWSDASVTADGFSDYDLPLEYFNRLVDFLPFDEHPLDAVKFLADSMNAYIWFDPGGDVIIRKWSTFDLRTPDENLDNFNAKFMGGIKNYFWDKLADSVEVYVKSWLPQIDLDGNWTGDYVDGAGATTNGNYSKERNVVKKTVVADVDTLSTYGITFDFDEDYWDIATKLNQYGTLKSSEFFDFYGKRHFAFDVTYGFDIDLIQLNVGDVVTFRSAEYFIVNLEYTLDEVSFRLVSVASYTFDFSTVIYNKTESIIGASSSNGGTANLAGAYAINVGGSSINGSEDIDTVGTITTGIWAATPIVADYLNYNPHNLDNDYYSGEINFVSEDSESNAVLQTTSAHSIRKGATVTLSDLNYLADGDYTVVNIPDSTSFTINASPSNTGSDSGYVVQNAHLNTIQDIGVLDNPQFYGLKVEHDSYLQYANYNEPTYVAEWIFKNSDPLINETIGWLRFCQTSSESSSFYLNLYDPINQEFDDVALAMSPEEGFVIQHGSSQMQFSGGGNYARVAQDPTTYMLHHATLSGDNLKRVSANNTIAERYFDFYTADFTISSGNVSGVGPKLELVHYNGSSVNAESTSYLSSGDVLGSLEFKAKSTYDAIATMASISAVSMGGWQSGQTPTRLDFYVMNGDAPSVSTIALTLNQNAYAGFGIDYSDITHPVTFADSYGLGNTAFVPGWQSGSGWQLDAESLGGGAYNYELTVDDLVVRGTLRVYELLVTQVRATNGNLLVTAAAKATSGLSGGYFEVEDVTEHGIAPFHSGDIIMCQVVNLSGASFDGNGDVVNDGYLVKRLVYEVSSVSGLKVYVSLLSGAPTNKGTVQPGDGFVRIGSTSDADRRGMVGIFTDEENAPFIRVTDGIASWANWKDQDYMRVQIGKLDGLIDPDFGGSLSGYGAYFQDNLYMKGNLNIKSDNAMALIDQNIMAGYVTGSADSAIKITVAGTLATSGIFLYDSGGDNIFAASLDGTVTIGDYINNTYMQWDSGVLTLKGVVRQDLAGNNLGDVRGSWITGRTYYVNDIVNHNGVSYICVQAHSSQEPPNGSYWAVWVDAGTPGTDAYTVKIVSETYVVQYDEFGDVSTPSSSFLLSSQVTGYTAGATRNWYKSTDGGSNWGSSIGTGTTLTVLEVGYPDVGEMHMYKAVFLENAIQQEDIISVVGIKEGTDTITIILTNEAHVVPTDPDGSNGNFTGASTNVLFYKGATLYSATQDQGVDPGEFRIETVTPTNCTTSGNDEDTVAVNSMSADTAYVDITVRYNIGNGEVVSPAKRFSLSKSKTGTTGETGVQGDPAERYYIYMEDGFAIHNSTGTLGFSIHKTTGGVDTEMTSGDVVLMYWTGSAFQYLWLLTTNGDEWSTTMDSADINGTRIIYAYDENAGVVVDTLTVVDVTDGVNGVNGSDGDTGPGVVYRGVWDSEDVSYYYNTSIRRDVVKGTDNNYYLCKLTHTPDPVTKGPPPTGANWSDYWESFGASFSSVATDILLAQDATILNGLVMGDSTNAGWIRSYGVASLEGNGSGFFLTAQNTGSARIGTYTGGELVSGFLFDGSDYQLRSESSSHINEVTSNAGYYWDMTKAQLDSAGIITDYNFPNGDCESSTTGWIFDSYFGVTTSSGRSSNYAHGGTYSIRFRNYQDTHLPLLKINPNIKPTDGEMRRSITGLAGSTKTYTITFWSRWGDSPYNDEGTFKINLTADMYIYSDSGYSNQIAKGGIELIAESTEWKENSVTFTTSNSTVYVAIKVGKSDWSRIEQYEVEEIYVDDFDIYSTDKTFAEISDDGIHFFRGPSSYMKIGQDGFEMKGMDLETEDLRVRGDLIVTGNIGVVGTVSAIPPGYNNSEWDIAYSILSDLDTKGKLLTYSTSQTTLSVGSDNQVLIANSGQSTGLQWTNALSGLTSVESDKFTTAGANLVLDIASGYYLDITVNGTKAWYFSPTGHFVPQGSIGAVTIGLTGSRVDKVWTDDLEITNMPTVGGLSLPATIDLGDLADVNVSGVTDGQILVYASGTWNKSNYPSTDWSVITNKPTTISGYGITDALTTTGANIKTAGSLTFNDNIGLNIGSGTDLNIYASGTTAHIDIGASSTLYIEQQSNYLASFGISNDARLYFGQGALKLQTEDTGVKVTGVLNATSGIEVNGSALALEWHLDDVDVDQFTLANGQVLVYNSTSGKWENGAAGSGVALDDLSDVGITSPALGHILQYDGFDTWGNLQLYAGIDGDYGNSYQCARADHSHSNYLESSDLSGYAQLSGATFTGNVQLDQYFRIVGDSLLIPHPMGGQYSSESSSQTGFLRIMFPGDVGEVSDMISFWVDIFDYDDNGSTSIYIAGYNNTGWSNCSAIVLTSDASREYEVTFVKNSTTYQTGVFIGTGATNWEYVHVSVRDVYIHYNITASEWYGGDWSITVGSSSGFSLYDNITSTLPVANATSIAWSNVTGTPTTLAGYGITDAASSSHTHNDKVGIYGTPANGTLGVWYGSTAMAGSSVTTTDVANGATAYGWGNHASAGYLTSAVTSATGGTGIDVTASTGAVTFNLDLSELTDMTATMLGTDEFIVLDGGADRRKAANEIGLSIFNNDAGFIGSSTLSSYLRSDAADTKTVGDLTMGDNVAINFGAGTDAEIYSNGTNVYLNYGTLFEIQVDGNPLMTFGYDYVELNLFGTQGPKILEIDSNEYIIGVSKNSAYNKNFGTSSGTVAEGDHDHDGDYQSHAVLAQGNSSTPPNVSGKVMYRITSYAGSGALETINGGSTGQILVVVVDTNYTFSVVETGNIRTIGSGLSLGQYDSVVFIYTGSIWHQITPVANY